MRLRTLTGLSGAYWADIGTPDEYVRATADALAGRVHLRGTRGRGLASDAILGDDVRVEGDVRVGSGAKTRSPRVRIVGPKRDRRRRDGSATAFTSSGQSCGTRCGSATAYACTVRSWVAHTMCPTTPFSSTASSRTLRRTLVQRG